MRFIPPPQLAYSAFLCLSLAVPTAHGQENWSRFRGADGTGVVPDDPRLVDTWDQQKNVRWRTTIPGWGWGSPIVWGDRVFVSAVHSDDDYDKPKAGLYLGLGRGDPPDSVHHWMVYCLSLATGEILWKHECMSADHRCPGIPKIPTPPKLPRPTASGCSCCLATWDCFVTTSTGALFGRT